MQTLSKKSKLLNKKHALRASQMLQQAWKRHQAGFFQEAESAYQSLLCRYPDYPDALHLYGLLAMQSGQHEIAITRLEQALIIKPDFIEIHNSLGNLYKQTGQLNKATQHYEDALAINPSFAEAHYNLGLVLELLNHEDKAIYHYEQALEISPNYAKAHNNLASLYKLKERVEDALHHYQQALSFQPDLAEAYNNLGLLQIEQGRIDEGMENYYKAIKFKPDLAEAHFNLGNALLTQDKTNKAIEHYINSININPNYAEAHNNLGTAYKELRDTDNALAHYNNAIYLKPEYAEAYNNVAVLYQDIGDKEQAIKHYQKAIAIDPAYAGVYFNLSKIEPSAVDISDINKHLNKTDLSVEDTIYYHYSLANIYHSQENYTQAFIHHQEGNSLRRKTIHYNASDHSNYINSLINTYSYDYFENMIDSGSDSRLPVFIVGMPRSGTSLVEQILSSHKDIYGAGELGTMGRIELSIAKKYKNSISYPECINLCDVHIFQESANDYLNELNNFTNTSKLITDKMPNNFLRIGLIKTLFPNAKIIHCKRNPLDTCTSIFLTHFSSGSGNDYSLSLEDTGQYYLDYQKLMHHWHTIFPGQIFDVQYEEMVSDQESVSRQLINYLDMEWDSVCLKFHQNKRQVKTASNLQVRQPIYNKSVNRWKRYEEQLQPLLNKLQPIV